MAKKLIRGKDWHGWCWYYESDPNYGTKLDTSEVYESRVRWAHAYRRKGRWVRVRIVPVDKL